jgi:hypothetical protein
VRRIGSQRHDQRDGRDKRDQTITAKARAQEEGTICRRNKKRSLRVASGQLKRSESREAPNGATRDNRSATNPEKRPTTRRGTTGPQRKESREAPNGATRGHP